MGGTALTMKGAGPAVPQTVWFGTLPDRLNMLLPHSNTFWSGGLGAISASPANFGNSWGPHHGSLTSNTTAPDGTTNVAQKFIEDNTTNEHYLLAGAFSGFTFPQAPLGVLRMAAYLKNGNRRVGFKIYIATDPTYSLQAVFDLAGGQVGVSGTIVGSPGVSEFLAPVHTEVVPVGNGWYLCAVDFQCVLGTTAWLLCDMFLDNGTGTGAISISYAGDGSSGSFVWRTNMFPSRGYAFNSVVFRDDFTSLSTIDTGNTKAPGFNWYMSGWSADTGAPGTSITQSGSTITIGATGTGTAVVLTGMGQTHPGPSPPGAAVGTNAWTFPILWEAKFSFPNYLTTANFNHASPLWSWPLAWSVNNGLTSPVAYQKGGEWDISEVGNFSYNRPSTVGYNGTAFQGFATSVNLVGYSQLGLQPWSATTNYNNNASPVMYVPDGNFNTYGCIDASGNLGNIPPSSPAHWLLNSQYPASGGFPFIYDITQLGTLSALALPSQGSPDGPPGANWVGGHTFIFWNGALCGCLIFGASNQCSTAIASLGNHNSGFWTLENEQWFPILNSDEFQASKFDFFQVMQP